MQFLSYHGAMASIADRTNMCGYEIRLWWMLSMRGSLQGSQRAHRRTTAASDYRVNQWRKVVMIKGKVAVLTFALSAFAAPAALGQAAIQEPGAFEFYHPNEDVLNGGAQIPEAALVSTTRMRDAFAVIDSGSVRSHFDKLSARRQIGTAAGRSWCLHDYVHDYVDCSFSNRSQCVATASGGLGECSMNQ
jgi:hypothetical protein